MVNYVNPLAMYQGKGQYAGGWYGWQPQNFEEQQWCGWNGPATGDWVPDSHHFPKREPGEREVGELPSPARGDLASPGGSSPCSRPAQPPPPAPPRSPYEWMKKPNYQTQQNPGKAFEQKIGRLIVLVRLGRGLPADVLRRLTGPKPLADDDNERCWSIVLIG